MLSLFGNSIILDGFKIIKFKRNLKRVIMIFVLNSSKIV